MIIHTSLHWISRRASKRSSRLIRNFFEPPDYFTRVGPGRKKSYVLYDVMFHNDWVDCWLETGFGKKSKIHWDSKH